MSNKKRPWRRFVPNVPTHIYQTSADKGIIFYDEILILNYFCILCVNSVKYDVTVLSCTNMLNHLHNFVIAKKEEDMTSFMVRTNSEFARGYNRFMGRSGRLFKMSFDYAPKRSEKLIRSTLNYIANNGPEKKLSHNALSYKWNFLAYAIDKHPYSSKYYKTKVSLSMRCAVGSVKDLCRHGKPAPIEFLLDVRSRLQRKEWMQFVDILINEYNVIDYDKAARYFGGSVERMVMAPDDNIGNEWDINEIYDFNSYVPFRDMASHLFCNTEIWSPFNLDVSKRLNLFMELKTRTFASDKQIMSFLHIKNSDMTMRTHKRQVH